MRYAKAPGNPNKAKNNHGAKKLSLMFSDTDSTVAAVACSADKLDGSRLTSEGIRARACSRSPRSRWPRTNAASRCSSRTEKVVFRRTPLTKM